MPRQIKTLYVIHHSHTDIGYTDLQERVVQVQVDYIRSALIASRDVPLYYFGEMRAHPIRLCENRPEDNRRPVYSWVMNNCWETNFKLDLSGFAEYRYTLWLSAETDPRRAMAELTARSFDACAVITG